MGTYNRLTRGRVISTWTKEFEGSQVHGIGDAALSRSNATRAALDRKTTTRPNACPYHSKRRTHRHRHAPRVSIDRPGIEPILGVVMLVEQVLDIQADRGVIGQLALYASPPVGVVRPSSSTALFSCRVRK